MERRTRRRLPRASAARIAELEQQVKQMEADAEDLAYRLMEEEDAMSKTPELLAANTYLLAHLEDDERIVARIDGSRVSAWYEIREENDYGEGRYEKFARDVDILSFDIAQLINGNVLTDQVHRSDDFVVFEWRNWTAAIGAYTFPARRSFDGRYGGVHVSERIEHPALGDVHLLHFSGQARHEASSITKDHAAVVTALALWHADLVNPGVLDGLPVVDARR